MYRMYFDCIPLELILFYMHFYHPMSPLAFPKKCSPTTTPHTQFLHIREHTVFFLLFGLASLGPSIFFPENDIIMWFFIAC